ncbi:MAG TPA: rhomboid family intramembrane serine protease [Flavobacteriaceae bacterium]|nr:rhomboid family intramembrane serine protease [Flavobacteriaceae bacterium]MCB9212439.1 rhomboid family intramembrane serine protease [Alteromonas sp.]HPF11715.1 rhomboid family intramembrane serine protease [Flavobacteriaceae bacterium]HQU20190.1 rhomboid family intramembrane serine protease [Flavobacteriaceae bacterium]HQU64721.1 rhomboid family intramembrane serine protease [Flavobacteriaceae bacterium]
MGRITDTVKHLIIINVLFFIGSKIFGNTAFDLLSLWFPENKNFHVWQIITHMFMHHPTFYFHIIFNMLGIYMFGSPLEQIWGKWRFLFFYFSCGIGAVLLPMAIDYYHFSDSLNLLLENGFDKAEILNVLNNGQYDTRWADVLGQDQLNQLLNLFNQNSLGASGALMGLLVAFGMYFPNAALMLIFLPIPIKAKYFIPLLLAYEIISGFTGGTSLFGINVGHWAHVGGALMGLVITYYWKKNSFNNRRWD